MGSNTPDCRSRMAAALWWLRSVLTGMRVSGTYSTPELSGRFAPYLNCVVCGSTSLSAAALETMLKERERELGRTPADKEQGRVAIDLDLVIYGDAVVRPRELGRMHFQKGYGRLNP